MDLQDNGERLGSVCFGLVNSFAFTAVKKLIQSIMSFQEGLVVMIVMIILCQVVENVIYLRVGGFL